MADFQQPASAGVAAWAELGAQLVEALLQRLDDRRAPRDDPEPAGPAPLDPRLGRAERARRILAARNARVASALGACRCWGRSAACPRCGGRGRPGALPVAPDAFVELVVPLLEAQPELVLGHLRRIVEVQQPEQ